MTAAWVVAVLLGAGLTFVLVAAEEALLRMSPSRAEELADEGGRALGRWSAWSPTGRHTWQFSSSCGASRMPPPRWDLA